MQLKLAFSDNYSLNHDCLSGEAGTGLGKEPRCSGTGEVDIDRASARRIRYPWKQNSDS